VADYRKTEVRDEKSAQSDRARIIGSAQIRVNNRRGIVRPRTGNFARIFRMFVIRKRPRNVAVTAHRFNETFIRSQHLTCQVSRPSTYRTASNAGECQKRNDQEDRRIAARRICAGSLSSVDPWLSGAFPPCRGAALPGENSHFQTIFAGSALLLLSVYLGACAGSSGTAADRGALPCSNRQYPGSRSRTLTAREPLL
jgi:hypothetical protein